MSNVFFKKKHFRNPRIRRHLADTGGVVGVVAWWAGAGIRRDGKSKRLFIISASLHGVSD